VLGAAPVAGQVAVVAISSGRWGAARLDTWKLSKDPRFVDKIKDDVGLYLDPPERAVVLCVDEKSQIQGVNTKRDEEPE
jgi:hypothetical protein